MLENIKQSILIVEDDEDLADGIRLSLESFGLCFTCCKTISEAKKPWNRVNLTFLFWI